MTSSSGFLVFGRFVRRISTEKELRNSQVSSTPRNPHVRPPSYSLLGILLGVRLLHRLISFLRTKQSEEQTGKQRATNADEEFVAELTRRLKAELGGIQSVHSSRDLAGQLTLEEQAVAQAVDMAVLVASEVFVGNGVRLPPSFSCAEC